MTGSVAKKGLQRYMNQLQRHPLRTKAITAGVLSAISDIVSQKLSGIQKLQLRRLLLKVLFGCAYLGPFGHFFHTLLDKFFKGKKDPKTVAQKEDPGPMLKLKLRQIIRQCKWQHGRNWLDKPSVRPVTAACDLPEHDCIFLGYLPELTGKICGSYKTLSKAKCASSLLITVKYKAPLMRFSSHLQSAVNSAVSPVSS